jgi:hypothetical protein
MTKPPPRTNWREEEKKKTDVVRWSSMPFEGVPEDTAGDEEGKKRQEYRDERRFPILTAIRIGWSIIWRA